uniref:Aminotransferase class I/classII large domain-containing protein n=1 Tax=Heterosigma akashiwo TaxID=2829 RepID=A0A7S3UP89_HETAK
MDSDGVIVGQIERLLESGTIPAMLYTIPVFHNPTGCSLSKSRLDRLMLLSQKYGFYIVADEPYQFLNYENAQTQVLSKMTSAPNGSRIISLGTFSKIFAPGLRLGWIHTSPSIVNDLLSTAVIQSGGCINPLVAGLVHSAILQGTLQNHLERLVGTYQARKRAICKALREKCPDIEFDEPDGGYFVWVKIPPDVDAARLLEVARGRHGVAFTPGPRCSAAAAGGEGERFADRARLSFAFYDARELEEGIDRLAKALAEVRHSSHKNDDK